MAWIYARHDTIMHGHGNHGMMMTWSDMRFMNHDMIMPWVSVQKQWEEIVVTHNS